MLVGKSNSSSRSERTRATRRRILAAARDLFVERGYGAIAVQEVANRASVAVQTIYFGFGSKRGLLKEVLNAAITGDDQSGRTMDGAWFNAAMAADTAAELLGQYVSGIRDVLERTAAISEVVAGAATVDPEVAAIRPQEADPRYIVMLSAAKHLVTKPDAPPGLSAEAVGDLLYGLLSPELFLVLVRDRGWTAEKWAQWATSALRAQLCVPSA